MTEKEKAKAYDEALERARKLKEDPQGVFYEYSPKEGDTICDYIFHELAESEDERIRKTLIDLIKGITSWNYFLGISREQMIAWLEKQDEQKETLCDKCKKAQPSHSCQDITALGRCYIEGINKSNNVKPNFKVGDWITDDEVVFHITSYHIDYGYQLETQKGILFHFSDEKVENKYHLWTIKDAKDGDVLAFDNETIVIFKDLYNTTTFHSYCHVEEGVFSVSKDDMPDWWKGKGFHPATKEQRDLLFQKLKKLAMNGMMRRKN